MAVGFEKVVNGTAVTGYDTLESPFVALDALQITGVATTRLTVDALICAHDFLHIALLDKCLEGWQIGLPKVTLGKFLNVDLMTVPFRSAVDSIVFGTGKEFLVTAVTRSFFEILSLETIHDSQSHPRRQIGVFTVCFLSASPSGVTEDVDVGTPE